MKEMKEMKRNEWKKRKERKEERVRTLMKQPKWIHTFSRRLPSYPNISLTGSTTNQTTNAIPENVPHCPLKSELFN
jgi:hypothetical protein